MWKRQKGGKYERTCCTCGGTGKETLDQRGSNCGCPWDRCEEVDHPSNTANHSDAKYKGIWNKVVRCNRCGLFWVIYFESQDDSWDVPGPECIGICLPAEDWQPGKEKP